MPTHNFLVKHLGISTIQGDFTKITGTVMLDDSDITNSSVNVTIDVNSVDTRVQRRDDDLRSEHFFDVAKYPTMTFQSTKITKDGDDKLTMTGNLTIRGVTKEVTLDVTGPTKAITAMGGLRARRFGDHKNQSAGFRRERRSRDGRRRYNDFDRPGDDSTCGDEVGSRTSIDCSRDWKRRHSWRRLFLRGWAGLGVLAGGAQKRRSLAQAERKWLRGNQVSLPGTACRAPTTAKASAGEKYARPGRRLAGPGRRW